MFQGPGSGKMPKMVTCYLCGSQFGTTSVSIHHKACLKKRKEENANLPKAERKTIPDPPDMAIPTKKDSSAYFEEYNNAAYQSQNTMLIPCQVCNRTFLDHSRLEKHMKGFHKSESNTNRGSSSSGSSEFNANSTGGSKKVKKKKVKKKPGKLNFNPSMDQTGSGGSSSMGGIGGGGGFGGGASAFGSSPRGGPKSLMCHICGQQFGTNSLGIHIPQCKTKFKKKQKLLFKHERKKLPKAPTLEIPGPKAKWSEIDAYNAEATEIYSTSSMVPCPSCGRTFSEQDRMIVHLRSCDSGNSMLGYDIGGGGGSDFMISGNISSPRQHAPGKQIKMPKTIVCYVCQQEFGTASITIHTEQCLVKREKVQKLMPKDKRTKVPAPPNMRLPTAKDKEAYFLEYNTAARNHYETHMSIPCWRCGRTFASLDKVEKHLKGCHVEPGTPNRFDEMKLPALGGSGTYDVNGIVDSGVEIVVDGEDDGRVQCDKCQRKFAGDRIEKHRKVCKGTKIKSPRTPRSPSTPSSTVSSPSTPNPDDERPLGSSGAGQYDLSALHTEQVSDDGRVACEKCERKFASDRIEKHRKVCKGTKIKSPRTPRTPSSSGGGGGGGGAGLSPSPRSPRTPSTPSTPSASNPDDERPLSSAGGGGYDLSELETEEIADDGRVACEKCERKFAEDRIDKHRKVCKGTKIKPRTPRRAFASPSPQPSKQTSESSSTSTTSSSSSGDNAFSGLIACKKCQRTFAADRVEKHERICKGKSPRLKAGSRTSVGQPSSSSSSSSSSAGGKKRISLRERMQKAVQSQLRKCPKCSRMFAADRVKKHISVCPGIMSPKKSPRWASKTKQQDIRSMTFNIYENKDKSHCRRNTDNGKKEKNKPLFVVKMVELGAKADFTQVIEHCRRLAGVDIYNNAWKLFSPFNRRYIAELDELLGESDLVMINSDQGFASFDYSLFLTKKEEEEAIRICDECSTPYSDEYPREAAAKKNGCRKHVSKFGKHGYLCCSNTDKYSVGCEIGHVGALQFPLVTDRGEDESGDSKWTTLGKMSMGDVVMAALREEKAAQAENEWKPASGISDTGRIQMNSSLNWDSDSSANRNGNTKTKSKKPKQPKGPRNTGRKTMFERMQDELVQCPSCERKFSPDRLEKHFSICSNLKNFNLKRK